MYSDNMQFLSREELEKVQSERLVKVVKRVYDNVEIYRKKMDAIGLKPEDIKSIKDITIAIYGKARFKRKLSVWIL